MPCILPAPKQTTDTFDYRKTFYYRKVQGAFAFWPPHSLPSTLQLPKLTMLVLQELSMAFPALLRAELFLFRPVVHSALHPRQLILQLQQVHVFPELTVTEALKVDRQEQGDLRGLDAVKNLNIL
jgi:hypothetical protein